jgi:hypothetical protein
MQYLHQCLHPALRPVESQRYVVDSSIVESLYSALPPPTITTTKTTLSGSIAYTCSMPSTIPPVPYSNTTPLRKDYFATAHCAHDYHVLDGHGSVPNPPLHLRRKELPSPPENENTLREIHYVKRKSSVAVPVPIATVITTTSVTSVLSSLESS